MTHLDIQTRTTITSAAAGSGVDISGITGNWTLVLEVMGMNSGDTARFVFEDSVNAFSAALSGPSASVTGQVGSDGTSPFVPGANPTGYEPNVKRYTWNTRDFPSLRFGVTDALLRMNVQEMTGSSKSVTFQAFVEY